MYPAITGFHHVSSCFMLVKGTTRLCFAVQRHTIHVACRRLQGSFHEALEVPGSSYQCRTCAATRWDPAVTGDMAPATPAGDSHGDMDQEAEQLNSSQTMKRFFDQQTVFDMYLIDLGTIRNRLTGKHGTMRWSWPGVNVQKQNLSARAYSSYT